MKKFIGFLRDVAFLFFLLALCGMIHIMRTGDRVSVFGYQVLRVLTASMEPTIPENTCILIRETDPSELKVGDIITFISDDPAIQGYCNTHRIYQINRENGNPLFVTKGDAYPEPDYYPVHVDQVVGKYEREIPYGKEIGKAFVALSDNKNYFLFVILPLSICMLSYFWQVVSLIANADEEDQDMEKNQEETDDQDLEEDKGIGEDAETAQASADINTGR